MGRDRSRRSVACPGGRACCCQTAGQVPPTAPHPAAERHGDDRLPVALGACPGHRRGLVPGRDDAPAGDRVGTVVGTAPGLARPLTVVLVPMIMAILRAERPMLRLPAGIGPGLDPALQLAGLAASLIRLVPAHGGRIRAGRPPALAHPGGLRGRPGRHAALRPQPGPRRRSTATPQPAPAAPAAESSLNEVPATGGQTHIWLKVGARSMSRAHAAALRGAAGKPARKRHDLDHQRDARPRDGDDKQDAHGG